MLCTTSEILFLFRVFYWLTIPISEILYTDLTQKYIRFSSIGLELPLIFRIQEHHHRLQSKTKQTRYWEDIRVVFILFKVVLLRI